MAKKKSSKRRINRKENNTKKKVVEEDDFTIAQYKNAIIVILCVLLVFLGFYFATLRMTKKNSEDTNTPQETQISYENILVGQSLSQKEEEYYVIFYDTKDEESASDLEEMVSNYRYGSGEFSLYSVDMSDGLNKSFTTEEEANRNPESAKDFLIHGPTLIKVKEGKVIEYYEGMDMIQTILPLDR